MRALVDLFSVVFLSSIYSIAMSGTGTPGGQWESYNKSLDGIRYSPLKEINTSNVDDVVETCHVQIAERGAFETGPVVVKGLMFVTTPSDTIALDPVTCAVRWRYEYWRTYPPIMPVNRGVAYLNGRVYRGTDDGRVFALDAQTGQELWASVIGDGRLGEFVSGAPVAWNGLVIVGIASGDFGIRGRVVAYEAETGREVWRFDTVPVPPAMGADSWKGSDWSSHGGGGTWSTMSLDASTGELFIPVGNPVPAFSPNDRPGSNLFTDSVLVLDARTGALKWWYQLKAADPHDYDLAAAPILYRNSKDQTVVAAAGKDGYLHVVDRRSHNLLFKTAITTVDAHPVLPTPEGVKACPGVSGGVEWNGPAYDPEKHTIYVGAVDFCAIIRSAPKSKWVPGVFNMGGWYEPAGHDTATGWLTAVDSDTGAIRWKYHAAAPIEGGVVPTAGGLVLAGVMDGTLLMVDGGSGTVLRKVAASGAIAGGVVTYESNGRQYIAFASGGTGARFFGTPGRPTITVMALRSSVTTTDSHRASANVQQHGSVVYIQSCAICHNFDGKGITGVDLSTINSRMSAKQLIEWIKNPTPPMPKLFPEPLDATDERDIEDLAAFVLSWHP
jgi:alcohol dehydrogenase (cytochrome c)